jgi:hypothetical protein
MLYERLKRLWKRIIRFKVYIERSKSYLGYVNFILIFLLFLEKYKNTSFGVWFYGHSKFTVPAAIVLFIVVAVLWGYVDKKYIRPLEQDEVNQTNEKFMEMYHKIMEDD